jgi:hypothetical protein
MHVFRHDAHLQKNRFTIELLLHRFDIIISFYCSHKALSKNI